jgi:predicted membrane protein
MPSGTSHRQDALYFTGFLFDVNLGWKKFFSVFIMTAYIEAKPVISSNIWGSILPELHLVSTGRLKIFSRLFSTKLSSRNVYCVPQM